MVKRALKNGVLIQLSVVAGLAIAPLPAQAVSLNGWDYAIADFNNGVSGTQIGGGVFEFYSIAVRDTGSQMVVALNTNLPLQGDRGITYGDLFFNFTGKSFKAASDSKSLFSVRFAGVNSESGVAPGVYRNVAAKSVTQQNSGFPNLNEWSSVVNGRDDLGDLNARDSYFAGQQTGNGTVLNSTRSGDRVGDITLLTLAALTSEGLNFGSVGATGSQTIGFRFDKPQGFSGQFIASIFAECANDGLVIQSQAVPEPTTIAGLALAGGGLAFLRRRSRQMVKAKSL